MIVWAALMEDNKLLFLLPVGLALLLCTSVLVGSASSAAYGQQQQPNSGGNQNMTPTTNTGNNTGTSTGGTLDCDSAASVLRGMIIQNPAGVCDIAVPLQGVQVQDTATGASLNNLLIMNPLFEFVPVSNQATGSSSATTTTTGGNQTTVYGFAEFALIGGQLPSAMRMLANSSWNVVAVHNHVIGESPSMIFVHAIANGDINTLAKDTRTILDALMSQMQSSSGNQTSTTAGSGGGAGNANGTATGGGITGGNMTSNSSPSSSSLTGGTPTGNGSTAGGGVGTFGGGGGTTPSPDTSTSDGSGSGDGTTTGGTPTGGAAGPQVMP
jgi:Domain of Unknown Function (DUF1259)